MFGLVDGNSFYCSCERAFDPTLRGKPLVVNFWATWCPPCVREMPVLQRAQADNPDVHFVFVNQAEPRDRVADWLRARDMDLRHVLLDDTGRFGAAVGQRALGTVVGLVVGWAVIRLFPGPLLQAVTYGPNGNEYVVPRAAWTLVSHTRLHVTLLPGARELLVELNGAGVRCAVLTNKRGYAAREVCTHLGLDPLLAGVFGANDVPWIKPDPRFTQHGLAAIGGEGDAGGEPRRFGHERRFCVGFLQRVGHAAGVLQQRLHR